MHRKLLSSLFANGHVLAQSTRSVAFVLGTSFASVSLGQCVCGMPMSLVNTDSEMKVVVFSPASITANGCERSQSYAVVVAGGQDYFCRLNQLMMVPWQMREVDQQINIGSCYSSASEIIGFASASAQTIASSQPGDPSGFIRLIQLDTTSGIHYNCPGGSTTTRNGVGAGVAHSEVTLRLVGPNNHVADDIANSYWSVTGSAPTPPSSLLLQIRKRVLRLPPNILGIISSGYGRKVIGALNIGMDDSISYEAPVGPAAFSDGNVAVGMWDFQDADLDLNGDGRFNQLDVDALPSIFGSTSDGNGDPLPTAVYDVCGDGMVGSDDQAVLQELIDAGFGSGLFGDVNNDQVLCFLDYVDSDVFTHSYVLGDSAYQIELDYNLDGILDSTDATAYVAVVVPQLHDPDYNQDGNADQGDLDALLDTIAGGSPPANVDPDYTNDGNVDQGDFDFLMNFLGGGGC